MSFSQNSKIYIAGHNGMVGSPIFRNLKSLGYHKLILKPSKDLDLRNQEQTQDFFKKEQPEFIFLAAAKVGGILANSTFKADFIYDNLKYSIRNIIRYIGEIECDTGMPHETAQKFLDVSKINNLCCKADLKIKAGIALNYNWDTQNLN